MNLIVKTIITNNEKKLTKLNNHYYLLSHEVY